jgi:AraC family transcriptional regulator, exoenzyme S synthesis regulatory protein ExsA
MSKYPENLVNLPAVKMKHIGKSVLALFKLHQDVRNSEGMITENTILFVLNGIKTFHFPEGDMSLSTNDFILLRRGTYYMSNLSGGDRYFKALMLCMDDKFLKSFLQRHFEGEIPSELPKYSPFVIHGSDMEIAIRDSILKYLESQNENTSKLMELKLEELFLMILAGNYRKQLLLFLHQLFDETSNTIEYVVGENLLKPFTLAQYSKLCGLSLSSFKREFTKHYHASPKEWINNERLNRAHLMLQNTSKNVSEVAFECGFESASYFIKLYKSKYGVTPKNASRPKIATF